MDINQIIANIAVQSPAIFLLLAAIRQLYTDSRNDRDKYEIEIDKLRKEIADISISMNSLENQISNLITEYRRIIR